MKLTAIRLLILAGLFPFLWVKGQSSHLAIEKAPCWITHTTINYHNDALSSEAEDGYIHLSFEKQVSLTRQSTYIKKAIKVLSEAGVHNSSEIVLDFDPAYEQLILHTLKLIRGKETINKLALSKFKVMRQEKELDRHLFNGSLCAILILGDVRKGDVIEYSYTIKGFDPIFNGRYANNFETNFSIPVGQVYYKFISPINRTFTFKNKNNNLIPVIRKAGNEIIYEWQATNVSALQIQDKAPSWYDPYSYVFVSEYQSWKEVNDWARILFSFPKDLSSGLKKRIADIYSHHLTPEQRTAAALRFVQDDIRYMGIEMGESSYKPNHPNKTIERRFGDCKDKAYLLCTLLQAMGIEAHPVLVHSTYKNTITTWLPSPIAFDHATVQVVIRNEKYWLDPTLTSQRGPLATISHPDYQYGLVITDTTTSLTSIPHQENGMVIATEGFTVSEANGSTKLMVTTQYSGSFADNIRNQFSKKSQSELQHIFKNFYHSYFKGIRSDSISFTDNENTGIFTTKEYYTLSQIWINEKELKKITFAPFIINSILNKPVDADRTMPISLQYPAHYKENIEITLPENWNTADDAGMVDCAAFFLRYAFRQEKNKIRLQYEFKILKDHLSPEEIPAIDALLEKVDENVAYTIIKGGTTPYHTASSFIWNQSFLKNFPTPYIVLSISLLVTIVIKRQKGG